MADWTVFNYVAGDLLNKVHDFTNDPLYAALTNTAPALTDINISAITQITAAGGYTVKAAFQDPPAQVGNIWTVALDPITWTPSGADFDPFRYIVIYSSGTSRLIAYADYGSSYVAEDGIPFTVQASTLLRLTVNA